MAVRGRHKKKKVTIAAQVDAAVATWIQEKAEEEGVTPSEIIRRILGQAKEGRI